VLASPGDVQCHRAGTTSSVLSATLGLGCSHSCRHSRQGSGYRTSPFLLESFRKRERAAKTGKYKFIPHTPSISILWMIVVAISHNATLSSSYKNVFLLHS
jgi:hypothetical protein